MLTKRDNPRIKNCTIKPVPSYSFLVLNDINYSLQHVCLLDWLRLCSLLLNCFTGKWKDMVGVFVWVSLASFICMGFKLSLWLWVRQLNILAHDSLSFCSFRIFIRFMGNFQSLFLVVGKCWKVWTFSGFETKRKVKQFFVGGRRIEDCYSLWC